MRLIGRSVEFDLVRTGVVDAGQVLITGEPGVGKSTLLDVVATELADEGFVVVRVAGSPGLLGYPLAALGHVIGDPGALSGPALSSFGVERLCGITRSGGAVIVVDDAHVLDPWSLHVIASARSTGGPRILMASRGGNELPDAVASFGRFPGSTLAMQRLSAQESAELATSVLGAALDTPSAERVHQATDGLPLAVVELLRYAVRYGMVVLRSGLYRWDPTATPDGHLAALLGLRVDELDATDRDVVDALAIAGELPLDVVERLSATRDLSNLDLSRLERQRLIRAGPRPGWIGLGHPLLRDASLGMLGLVRRRDVTTRLVALLDGADPEIMRLRVTLAVDAGVAVPVDALEAVSAWGRAHGLWKTMEPVMERAWTERPGPLTGLAFGEALYWTRQMERAEAVFAAAEHLATSDSERIALATARARTLEIGLGRSSEAVAIRADELAHSLDPAERLELMCAQAERDLFDGNVTSILTVGDFADDHWRHDETGPMGVARYRLTQSTVGALGLRGRIGQMTEEYRLHLELADSFASFHPTAREVVDPWWVACNLLAGNQIDVAPTLDASYQHALTLDDGLYRPLWALPKAIEQWSAGDLDAAEYFAREAMGVPEAVVSIRRMATHFLARILELTGRHGEAREHAQESSGDDYVGIVQGWSAGVEHNCRFAHESFTSPRAMQASIDAVCGAIADLRGRGQLVPAAWVAHDLVRGGNPEPVVDELALMAADSDASSIRWMSEHARCLVANDGVGLLGTAAEAHGAGYGAMAVLIADDAVRVMVARRDVDGAGAASQRAAAYRSTTTAMPDEPASVADSFGLSQREEEVARAAAAGLTDQQIATELFISVRTVNAHLRAVYRKLGVSGRHDIELP